MRILLLAACAAAILAGGAVAMVAVSDDSLALSGSTTTSSPAVAPGRTTEDVSGPCDEAEHANDPRCTGTARSADRPRERHHRAATTATAPRHDADDDRVTGIDDDHRGGHGRDHPEDD